ncbi:MoxR family ATPase [Flavobacterium sp. xlx-214]|uniref:AAA family ATPase n=1 Tax=unclassified Flavobacterium TaxID=196869 RepID=UPI0013CF72DC|nr:MULTISPECIES: MoxR family ATPase [unclassified Flavobacterium]MBA5793981.1 MoxR family ATPase [Flavobacterium sp. xlx-221]QMI82650.1 MoxR family ATPase [Flavobacterium sp. xlx-214]
MENLENNEISFNSRIPLNDLKEQIQSIKTELQKVIVGQEELIDLLLVSLLSNGHVLIEGVPGLAKTLTAKLLAKTIQTQFSRIQFTPDLMPSDILGTSIFNNQTNAFEFKSGPVFSNFVLIDEINRAPAKTQSALFEVMEERQITIDGNTYQMEKPFIVLATQNPIEQEGTYSLPEAQLDRFLMKITIDYPTLEQEIQLLNLEQANENVVKTSLINPAITASQLIEFQQLALKVMVEPNLIQFIAQIVNNTRNHNFLYLGASPRASIAILNASKSFALINGRDFVTPDDIKYVAYYVLNHRLILAPEREMEGITIKDVVKQIVDTVEIPR